MTAPQIPRTPDSIITWRSYVLVLDDVCAAAGIPLSPSAEIEADFPDKTSLRLVIKEER